MKGLAEIEGVTWKVLLREMCKRVGANPNEIDFSQSDWYTEYTWTENQEFDFKDWIIDYLTKNKAALSEISNSSSISKKRIEKIAVEFIFMYGWKVKNL